jgi:rhamnosyltransferase
LVQSGGLDILTCAGAAQVAGVAEDIFMQHGELAASGIVDGGSEERAGRPECSSGGGASVCAVIVTYHPSGPMLENLARVMDQVQGLVVVDNGSGTDALARLRAAQSSLGFQLIENRENLGLAEALNRGIRWAKSEGHSWVILFDQDTKIIDGFVRKMFQTLDSHPSRDRLGALHPQYVCPSTGALAKVRRASDGGPITPMMSGALMPTWIFDRIGWFASEYFIDWVDHEYTFRIRAAGYLLADSTKAVLPHSAGNPQRVSWLGLQFSPTHHSSTRRYYMSRNRIAFLRRYFRVFPRWVSLAMADSARETIKCLLAERDRPRKLRSILLGTWDGLTGRMGRRDDV